MANVTNPSQRAPRAFESRSTGGLQSPRTVWELMHSDAIPMNAAASHLLVVTFLFLGASAAMSEGGQFKTLPDTASPDGAYVFAYGPAAATDKLEAFTEAAGDGASIPRQFQPNYLVNARTRKIAAAIPMLNDMELNLDSQHSSFHVAWSPDGRTALAFFNGRYSTDTAMWVDPAAKTFSDVTGPLKAPVDKIVLERNGKKLAEMLSSVWLAHARLHESGLLTLRASAADLGGGGSGLTFEYALQFQMTPGGGKVQFALMKSVPLMEGEISANDLESEMTASFNKLKATLDQKHHMALQEDQLAWLKKRNGIANDAEKASATTERIKDLRTRLVEP